MSGATPGQVLPGGVRKQAEKAMAIKPASSIPPRLLLHCMPPGPCPGVLQMTGCDVEVEAEEILSCPSGFQPWHFITAVAALTETGTLREIERNPRGMTASLEAEGREGVRAKQGFHRPPVTLPSLEEDSGV